MLCVDPRIVTIFPLDFHIVRGISSAARGSSEGVIMRIQALPRTIAASVFFLILAAASGGTAAQTCIQSGGMAFCGSPKETPWAMSNVCEEVSFTNIFRQNQWCIVAGGTPAGGGSCVGATPYTEGNVVGRLVEWVNRVQGLTTCQAAVTNDTGWGTNFTSGGCFNFSGDVYENGIVRDTARRLTIVCGGSSPGSVVMSIRKTRALVCPVGYSTVSVPGVGKLCARTLEDCSDCKLANPVTPLTGVKVE